MVKSGARARLLLVVNHYAEGLGGGGRKELSANIEQITGASCIEDMSCADLHNLCTAINHHRISCGELIVD